MFNENKFLCPICRRWYDQSEYLKTAISDPSALWLANMVTHYRHTHITSWNKCWGPGGGHYRSKWFKDYETEKALVNERAKRQIIRKCHAFLLHHNIKLRHFQMLQNNDEKTLQFAGKMLDGITYQDHKQLKLF